MKASDHTVSSLTRLHLLWWRAPHGGWNAGTPWQIGRSKRFWTVECTLSGMLNEMRTVGLEVLECFSVNVCVCARTCVRSHLALWTCGNQLGDISPSRRWDANRVFFSPRLAQSEWNVNSELELGRMDAEGVLVSFSSVFQSAKLYEVFFFFLLLSERVHSRSAGLCFQNKGGEMRSGICSPVSLRLLSPTRLVRHILWFWVNSCICHGCGGGGECELNVHPVSCFRTHN